MTTFHQTPSGGRLIVAQAPAATADPGATEATQKAKAKTTKPGTTTSAKPSKPASAGVPTFKVQPDLSAVPGLQTAGQSGINLLGGLVLLGIVIFTLIGLGRIAAGVGFDFPDHAQGGKKMLLYAVPIAFAASLVGELVGWGFGMGVV